MASPVRVLFVCTANICRSAYAEGYGRALVERTGAPLELASAGTHGFDAAPMDPPMAAELAQRGVDPRGFRSRRLTAAEIRWADLVLTAERRHRSFVLEEFPVAIARTFTLGQFVRRAGELRDGADDSPVSGADLIAAVGRNRTLARPEEDVADPYARGPEAAAVAAAQLSDLVGRLVPVLSGAAPGPPGGRRPGTPAPR